MTLALPPSAGIRHLGSGWNAETGERSDGQTATNAQRIQKRPLLELTLVIPAFNEASRLPDGAARLLATFDRHIIDAATTQVVLVDDGSLDGTAQRATEVFAKLPHLEVHRLSRHLGKGAAVRAGVGRARASRLAFLDADMAMDPAQLPALLGGLQDAEISIGSRFISGSSVDRHSAARSLGTKAFNLAVNAVTGVGLSDTQCGFKAFRTAAARLLFHCAPMDGLAFDVPLLYTARRWGMRIAQLPVQWRRVPGSKVHPIRDPLRMVGDVMITRARGRSDPQIPGLILTQDEGASGQRLRPRMTIGEISSALGDLLPVTAASETLELSSARGAVLVLLPLCDDGDVAAATAALSTLCPACSVEGVTIRAGMRGMPFMRD